MQQHANLPFEETNLPYLLNRFALLTYISTANQNFLHGVCFSSIVSKPGIDIFGNNPTQTTEKLKCLNCNQSYPANRYAPHLEKCLGLGRRSTRGTRK